MESALIIQPLIAGLSVGAFCLTYCFPFIGSFLAAEERTFGKNTLIVLEFLGGRLLGYLAFGLLVGFLGEKFDAGWLRLATNLSFIFLSIILVLYLSEILREKKLFGCQVNFFKSKSPWLMGFLMGLNLCPPFLLSVAYVFSQKSALYGCVYFALFFISSSVYFLPLVFVGLASRMKEFRLLGRVSGFIAALIFFVYGIYAIFHN